MAAHEGAVAAHQYLKINAASAGMTLGAGREPKGLKRLPRERQKTN